MEFDTINLLCYSVSRKHLHRSQYTIHVRINKLLQFPLIWCPAKIELFAKYMIFKQIQIGLYWTLLRWCWNIETDRPNKIFIL